MRYHESMKRSGRAGTHGKGHCDMYIELTEEQLRTRGGMLDEILEKTFDAAIIVGSDGKIIYNSEGSLKLRNIPRDVARGTHFTEVNPASKFIKTLETGRSQLNVVENIQGRKCLVSVYPIFCRGEQIGALATMLFRNIDQLKRLISELLREGKLPENSDLNYDKLARVGTSYTFEDYIGESRCRNELVRQCTLAAHSRRPVLLIGETGTGKEILANAIHSESHVETWRPFIKINCSAIPHELLESELFGHEKGAFTGAAALKKGKFELADGGSVLLDEIGEMSPMLQSKLLRVLEEEEFERVGGTKVLPLNARIIASTNADLYRLCREGKFREDLYYRLSAFEIPIPPLRERAEDIPLIIENLKRRDQLEFELDPGALEVLQNYDWPGNVRELRNIVNRLDVRYHHQRISRDQAMSALSRLYSGKAAKGPPRPDCTRSQGEVRGRDSLAAANLRSALEKTQFNIAETARLLGVCRATVYNRMRRFNIEQN